MVFAVLIVACADWTSSSGQLDLERCEGWVRTGHTLTFGGLWANADVSLDLLLRPRVQGRAQIRVNDDRTTVRLREPRRQTVTVAGKTDARGALRIGVMPMEKGHGQVHVEALCVRQKGPARIPAIRWAQYLILIVLGGGFGYWAAQGVPGGYGGLLGTAFLVAAGIWVVRLQALMFLPWAILLFGIALFLAGVATVVLKMPRSAAALVCLVFLVRTTAFLQPPFPAIDAAFHSENLQRFMAGEIIQSAAPGPEKGGMAVPYPTVFYAVLSPIAGSGWPTLQFLVRLAMAILEGTAPLLVFAIMRAAGTSDTAAAYGAALQAAMPEGVLVLGKGIAANITGGWTSLLATFGIVSGMSSITVTGLLVVALLSHLGSAVTFLSFVLLYAAYRVLRKESARRQMLTLILPACAALALAWLIYYWHVQGTTHEAASSIGEHMLTRTGDFFGVRWFRVGKVLQDLVLKFGAIPLVLAWFGMRQRDMPDRLREMLVPWLITGIATGSMALLTPLPLRFEYLLVPAVAMAAGIGLERRSRRWVIPAIGAPLLIQLGLAGTLLARRFYLISVVMESPRWPFPFGR